MIGCVKFVIFCKLVVVINFITLVMKRHFDVTSINLRLISENYEMLFTLDEEKTENERPSVLKFAIKCLSCSSL